MEKRKLSFVSLFDKVAEWALLLTVGLLPLWFIPSIGISLETAKFGLLFVGSAVSVIFYLLARFIDGEWKLPNKISSGLLLGTVAVFVLSNLFATDSKVDSFFGQGYELGTTLSAIVFVAISFMSYVYFGSQEKLRRVLKLIGVSFVVAVVYQLIRFVVGDETLSLGSFFGRNAQSVGRYSDFAIFAGAVAVVSTVILETRVLTRSKRLPLLVLLVLALFILVAVNFPFVWTVIFIFSLWAMFYGVLERGEFKTANLKTIIKKPAVYVAAISLLLLISNLSNPVNSPKLFNISQSVPNALGVGASEVRPPFELTVLTAYETLASGKILGVGPNRFLEVWKANTPKAWTETNYWGLDFNYGFGLIPTLAVTVGIVGFLVLASLMGRALYLGARAVFSPEEKTKDLAVLFFVVLYLLVFAVSYLPAAFLVGFLFVALGILFAAYDSLSGTVWTRTSKRTTPRKVTKTIIISLLIIGSVYTAYELAMRYLSARYFALAYTTLNQQNNANALIDAEAYLNKAIKYNPEHDGFYRLQSEIALFQSNLVVARATEGGKKDLPSDAQQQALGYLQQAQSYADKAIAVNPSYYSNYLFASKLYGVDSNGYEKIKSFYEEALKRNPSNPEVYLGLAQLEAKSNNIKAARAFILQAIAIKPNYVEGYTFLAQLDVDEKQIDDAIRNSIIAFNLDQTNAVVAFNLANLLYVKGSYSDAAQMYAATSNLSPYALEPIQGFAASLVKANRTDEAIEALAEVKKRRPELETSIDKIIDGIKKPAPESEETKKEE